MRKLVVVLATVMTVSVALAIPTPGTYNASDGTYVETFTGGQRGVAGNTLQASSLMPFQWTLDMTQVGDATFVGQQEDEEGGVQMMWATTYDGVFVWNGMDVAAELSLVSTHYYVEGSLLFTTFAGSAQGTFVTLPNCYLSAAGITGLGEPPFGQEGPDVGYVDPFSVVISCQEQPVPDGGWTVALMGIAFAAAGVCRRLIA